MLGYIARRLLLMIPTLLGILVVNFLIVQTAPGGPVEQMVARIKDPSGGSSGAQGRGGAAGDMGAAASSQGAGFYRGAQGIDPDLLNDIKHAYGFDKPPIERFFLMVGNYARFDFGQSFFRDRAVVDIILEKLPTSISLGLWTTLLVYLISIPHGFLDAERVGVEIEEQGRP